MDTGHTSNETTPWVLGDRVTLDLYFRFQGSISKLSVYTMDSKAIHISVAAAIYF